MVSFSEWHCGLWGTFWWLEDKTIFFFNVQNTPYAIKYQKQKIVSLRFWRPIAHSFSVMPHILWKKIIKEVEEKNILLTHMHDLKGKPSLAPQTTILLFLHVTKEFFERLDKVKSCLLITCFQWNLLGHSYPLRLPMLKNCTALFILVLIL